MIFLPAFDFHANGMQQHKKGTSSRLWLSCGLFKREKTDCAIVKSGSARRASWQTSGTTLSKEQTQLILSICSTSTLNFFRLQDTTRLRQFRLE